MPKPSWSTNLNVNEIHKNRKKRKEERKNTTWHYIQRTLWRYVSEFLGKSKLITTLTAWMSIPRVKRSADSAQKRERNFYKYMDTQIIDFHELNWNSKHYKLQRKHKKIPVQTRFRHAPFRKSWNTLFRWSCSIFAWI